MATFTREAIKEAFLSLLEERPLNKITVKDIVERCGVNRNTFYYHFPDLPTLAETVVIEEAQKIIETTLTVGSMEDCVDAMLRDALARRKAVWNLYHSTNREIYEASQWRVARYVVELYLNTLLEDRTISEQDRGILADYLRCSLFGLVMGWLDTGLDPNIRERFHRLCQLMEGEIQILLERAEQT